MATLRYCAPAISPILRLTTQPATITPRRLCAYCRHAQRRQLSSFHPARQSSKRPLMTESLRPHTLESNLPPPARNEGVPETSINTGNGQQQAQEQEQTWPPSSPWQRQDSQTGVSEREGEAQKSKPTTAATTHQQTTSSQPSTKAGTPKKSKLRARKAPITLTPPAVHQLRQLFDQPSSKLIRIGVKNRGCSGLAYHLEYVDKAGAFDEAVEQDGVKILIDSKALFSIIGSEMDWQQDRLSAKFVFRNPNISEPPLPSSLFCISRWRTVIGRLDGTVLLTSWMILAEQCGCGESFSIS